MMSQKLQITQERKKIGFSNFAFLEEMFLLSLKGFLIADDNIFAINLILTSK